MAIVRSNGSPIYLGYYSHEADAALAHDEAVRLLQLQHEETNFDSLKDYEDTKQKAGGTDDGIGGTYDGMSSSAIISKVKELISRKRDVVDVDRSDEEEDDRQMSVASDSSALDRGLQKPYSNENGAGKEDGHMDECFICKDGGGKFVGRLNIYCRCLFSFPLISFSHNFYINDDD